MSSCENNHAFRSLRCCRETCWYENGKTNQPPTEDSRDKRFQYKVIDLKYEEYSISRDGVLQILDTQLKQFPTTQFPPSDYIVHENSVKLCYPLDVGFYVCNKYQIPSTQTEFIDHSVLVKNGLARPVDAESFFVYKNHTILCDSDSSLTTIEIIHFVACLLSAICLLFTLFVNVKLKLKLQLNLGLLCHICMLFFGYTLLSIKLIVAMTLAHFCLVVALLQQFCFLSAFFWLNVQSVSLYRTLRNDMKPALKTSKWHVTLCLVYACGVPLLITTCTMLAEVLQLKPFFPYFQQNCWFLITDRATSFLFYYGPMTWTLAVNIFFFVGIVWHLSRVGRNVQLVNKKIHKQLFLLCIKLMIVMCFCWFVKIAFWGVGILENVWAYMDIITYFQGLFIFLVYACKGTVVERFSKMVKNSFNSNK
uniref:G-protein coupled receptors family 2 profile 2 domain-containing protein n=1 Tax=Strigamia maritima TaxID=126957 RepID=T1IX87_STRMM